MISIIPNTKSHNAGIVKRVELYRWLYVFYGNPKFSDKLTVRLMKDEQSFGALIVLFGRFFEIKVLRRKLFHSQSN